MAKLIGSVNDVSFFTNTSRRPWEVWLDGNARILFTKAAAKDYNTAHPDDQVDADLEDDVNMFALRASIYRRASDRGGHAKACLVPNTNGGQLAVQFLPGPGPRAGQGRKVGDPTPEVAPPAEVATPAEVAPTPTPEVAPPTFSETL